DRAGAQLVLRRAVLPPGRLPQHQPLPGTSEVRRLRRARGPGLARDWRPVRSRPAPGPDGALPDRDRRRADPPRRGDAPDRRRRRRPAPPVLRPADARAAHRSAPAARGSAPAPVRRRLRARGDPDHRGWWALVFDQLATRLPWRPVALAGAALVLALAPALGER